VPEAANLELSPALGELPPFFSHWHVRELLRDGCTVYEVRDSKGAVVAAEIKTLAHARLFALAPLLFENYQSLEKEATRALWYMVDVNQGDYDVEDVAEDVDGEFEASSPGAPEHAQWLLEVGALRDAVGGQEFPPVGTPYQAPLFTA